MHAVVYIGRFRRVISALLSASYLALSVIIAFHVHEHTQAVETSFAQAQTSAHQHEAVHSQLHCPLSSYAASAFLVVPAGSQAQQAIGCTGSAAVPAPDAVDTRHIHPRSQRGPPFA